MNAMVELMRSPRVNLLGEVLVHFLWQGAAVAVVLAFLLWILRHGPANSRYLISLGALSVLAILPILTGLWLLEAQQEWFAGSGQITTVGVSEPIQSLDRLSLGKTRANSVLPWLALGWLLGSVVLLLRLTGGWWRVQRLSWKSASPLSSPWPERISALADRLGVQCAFRVLESIHIRTPLVLGWLRPVILLPVGLVVRLPAAQVEAILAHELAHIHRHDYLVNLLQLIIESLLFYHPAVWWVSRRIRIERELCCDELAVQAIGERQVLAEALVTLAERETFGMAFALAASGGPLMERVRRLLQEPGTNQAQSRISYFVTLILAACLGAGILWIGQRGLIRRAQESKSKVEPSHILSNQLAEIDGRISRLREELDQLRLQLRIPDLVAEGFQPLGELFNLGSEQLSQKVTELETRTSQTQEKLRKLRGITPKDRPYALNADHPSPLLQTLLGDLNIAEQKRSMLSPDFGPKHPEVQRLESVLAAINGQIDNIVRGVINSLEAQVEGEQSQLGQLRASLEQSEGDKAARITQYRPYLRARKELDTLERIREAIITQASLSSVQNVRY